MTALRSYLDPDQQTPAGPTAFMTERNDHEVRCGLCSRSLYVDEETYRLAGEAIESGRDNPFRCEICAELDDDIAH